MKADENYIVDIFLGTHDFLRLVRACHAIVKKYFTDDSYSIGKDYREFCDYVECKLSDSPEKVAKDVSRFGSPREVEVNVGAPKDQKNWMGFEGTVLAIHSSDEKFISGVIKDVSVVLGGSPKVRICTTFEFSNEKKISQKTWKKLARWMCAVMEIKKRSAPPVFDWHKVLGADSEKFRDFLRMRFDMKWLNFVNIGEDIKKADAGMVIRICSGGHSVEILLNKGHNKANVKFSSTRAYGLEVGEENGRLCVRYFGDYIFAWDKVPGKDEAKLRNALKKRFDIGWAENAKLKKVSGGKSIQLSSGLNSVEINLDRSKGKAELKIIERAAGELNVKEENGCLNVYHSDKRIWVFDEEDESHMVELLSKNAENDIAEAVPLSKITRMELMDRGAPIYAEVRMDDREIFVHADGLKRLKDIIGLWKKSG